MSPEHQSAESSPTAGPEQESTIRPSKELRKPENRPRLQLFLILRQAWKHLKAELCPDQPKSIYKKADDLVRNLPRWRKQIEEMYTASTGFVDLTRELEVSEDVLTTAQKTCDCLRQFIEVGTRHAHDAKDELAKLANLVESALGQINREFNEIASPSEPGAVSVSIDIAGRAKQEPNRP